MNPLFGQSFRYFCVSVLSVCLICLSACREVVRSLPSESINDNFARNIAEKATQQLFALPCDTTPDVWAVDIIDWEYKPLENRLFINVKIKWTGGFLHTNWYLIGQYECLPSGCGVVWKPKNFNKTGKLFICESKINEQPLGCVLETP